MSDPTRRHFLQTSLASAGALAFGQPAWANEKYPSKPIRFVMPFAAGGGSDVIARVMAEHLGKKLGQTIVVENITGAGGTIGAKAVVSAQPDGYTLLFTPQSPITIAGLLEQKPSYDPDRDLLPLAMVATTPAIVVVNPSLKVKTLQELAALTRDNPGKYFYGSPGEAHEYQLTAALLLKSLGGSMTHVPYRGVAPTVADVLAGQVQMTVAPIQAVKGYFADGRLVPLAVVGSERLKGVGDHIPTTAEAGVKDVTVYGWFGMFAPSKLPRDIGAVLSKEILALPKDPAYAKRLEELGFDSVAMPSDQFAATIKEHRKQWQSVVQLSSGNK
jgi:tripartite-type tricarboxylate transporter receptor subunit TctC